MFLKEGPDDELIKDLQVIVLAHADEERVRMSDPLAESIGQSIEKVLRNLKCYHQRELLYSVSLFLGEMGYHAGTLNTREPHLQERLELPIEDLELNVRTYNSLKRVGVMSVGDVAAATEQELRRIPYLGVKGIANIRHRLAIEGLLLSDEQKRATSPEWVVDLERWHRRAQEMEEE